MALEQGKPDSGIGVSLRTDSETVRSRMLVLVVDDDARILRFVRVALRMANYDTVTAAGGQEALALVQSAEPDIMVLDIVMSPMDGFEVLTSLRRTSKLPVIVVSAHSSAAEEALKLGANAFLGKPFRPDELVRLIRSILS